ncbi:PREDICTED: U-box domain-containing protein 3-like [Ipomoea nil]|uniref:U-box domain-containing protein 3-like n=1 Tax=Ipomoea nil TaxID=35883 RepID=UPI000901315E|nr:PREDICTED: U-box domain-containing protein 3-like [Ipomoea nil]
MTTSSSPSSSSYANSDGDSPSETATAASPLPFSSSTVVTQTLRLVESDDPDAKVRAAREIRRLTKTSQRYRRLFCNAVAPLVDMLRSTSLQSNQAALLALLNLAVKDDANKASIISAGALEPIIGFLGSENAIVQEDATAALLTLSASSVTKPIVSASGVIPLLVGVLRQGSPQAKLDAAMTLYNLSTYPTNLTPILQMKPIPHILTLLKSCKKTSKTAEKCAALIESLVGYEEGRAALTAEEDGVLSVVEVLETGSLKSREHAVGVLLVMCQSERCKYREAILREGAIPGVMQLTVQGTPKGKGKAKTLLRLLRDDESPCPRADELQADTLENIVSNLIFRMDAEEQPGKAKDKLAQMVQVSMEESLKVMGIGK